MEPERIHRCRSVSEGEKRFLTRLTQKYETGENKGVIRSYLIAGLVILTLFALARWIPWWPISLIVVEVIGLLLFHQYKRFSRFKSRLLRVLWRDGSRDGN